MTLHGGDARAVAEEAGIELSEITDFSANVNPRGLPRRAREKLVAEALSETMLGLYPEPSARRLRRALSKRLDVPPEAIVAGPGAEALLTPILRCLRASRALVPVPAFSEYKRVCEREEIEYTEFPLSRNDCFRLSPDRFRRSIETGKFDLVILNNPHNPSGSTVEPDDMLGIVDAAAGRGATLVLDEAFIDYVPGGSLAREAARRKELIVLRSLTKFYGCPALRVGYAIAIPETARKIASFLPTWPITEAAAAALAEAVTDEDYAQISLAENAAERERLREDLSALGLIVFSSAANYLLLELGDTMPNSAELRTKLLARHLILVRDCDSYEGLRSGRYLRVAVRAAIDNGRLIRALREELSAL